MIIFLTLANVALAVFRYVDSVQRISVMCWLAFGGGALAMGVLVVLFYKVAESVMNLW